MSRLKLSAVTSDDSGRYSCRPDTGGFASVTVHIKSGVCVCECFCEGGGVRLCGVAVTMRVYPCVYLCVCVRAVCAYPETRYILNYVFVRVWCMRVFMWVYVCLCACGREREM